MGLQVELFNSSVIIVAHEFNMSIINSIWLYKKGIFTEEELKNRPSLPFLVEAGSEDFNFRLIPDRLEFSINPKYDKPIKVLLKKITKIITELPETPYSATGFNFIYHVLPENNDIGKLSKSLFCFSNTNFCKSFDSDEARFGGYFSKNALGTRLKLDIKPMTLNLPKETKEVLQFSFNFHLKLLEDDNYKTILALFDKWDEAKELSNNILNDGIGNGS